MKIIIIILQFSVLVLFSLSLMTFSIEMTFMECLWISYINLYL